MRTALTSILTVALLATAAVGVASARNRTGDSSAGNSANSIVGAWSALVVPGGDTPEDESDDRYPPFMNYVSMHDDGTVVNSDIVVATGVGSWEKVGPRTYRARILHNNFFQDGALTSFAGELLAEGTALVDVTLEVEVSADGTTASGKYHTEFLGFDGSLLTFNSDGAPAIATGSVEWTRIGQRDDIVLD